MDLIGRAVLLATVIAAAMPGAAGAAVPGDTILVSRPAAFGPLASPSTNASFVASSDRGSVRTVADADGFRYVAFVSGADGLTADDDDRVRNVYVRDRALGTTLLVSRADGPAGAGADGDAYEPSISADGRWVAFTSAATNLAAGASGAVDHVYVRDLVAGTTRLLDRAAGPDGAIANDASFQPSLTVDGADPVVAFTSVATNLDGPTNGGQQVYVRDEGPSSTVMVSVRNAGLPGAGQPGAGNSSHPSLSTDSTTVAFESTATNLVNIADPNGEADVFLHVPSMGLTRVVSQAVTIGDGESRDPSIGVNGGTVRVAFTSTSTDFDPAADGDADRDVYVKQIFPSPQLALASRAAGEAGIKGEAPSGPPALSDDGNTVAFSSASANLTAGDTNDASDVFVRSGVFGTGSGPSTSLISRPVSGVEADGGSQRPSISRSATGLNNRLIAFETVARNMGAEDDDDFAQVYIRLSGVTLPPNPAALISRPAGAAPFRSGVNASSLRPQTRAQENPAAMSADGRYTVFLSAADELSAEDDDRFINVFRRDNLLGETVLVSRADGVAGDAANGTSATEGGGLVVAPGQPAGAPAISADGNRIAFASGASNLVPGDGNGRADVFVRDVGSGTTIRAAVRSDGTEIPAGGSEPAISADGLRVAFVTTSALDPLDSNGSASDVYLRDLAAGATTLVSRRGATGPAGGDDSSDPALDADGSHVAFASGATDLDPANVTDANVASDVWLRDVPGGRTTLVSAAAGAAATANKGSSAPAIDANGTHVAFSSEATDQGAPGDLNGALRDVFVRDTTVGATVLASRSAGVNGISGNGISQRPSLDASGTRVAFETAASDLVPGDVNGVSDVLVRDTVAQVTELVSRGAGPDGALAPLASGTPSLSADGDCVAFETAADTFVPMPAGSDHTRVVARALRGDCPFGPLVPPPAPPAGPGGGTPADRTAPLLTQVRLAPRRFLPGRSVRRATRRRRAVGARLRLTLSEPAIVRLRFDALLRGRRVRGRCVRPKRTVTGRPCALARSRGSLDRVGSAGANVLAVTGRVRGRALAPGSYRLTVLVSDAGGNAAAPRRQAFTVLRR